MKNLLTLSDGTILQRGQRLTVKALVDIPKDGHLPPEQRQKGLIKKNSTCNILYDTFGRLSIGKDNYGNWTNYKGNTFKNGVEIDPVIEGVDFEIKPGWKPFPEIK